VLGRRFGWHSPLNGKRSERVYDFT
jgi:hypothetical protein